MASTGAPNKAGLEYFPKMVNFYEDDKIFDLLDEYGPLGVTIYDCILMIVYQNGYFANLSKDKLSRMVIRKIGNKWVKNQKVVVQVIDYCADLGLLCNDLMLRDIITSEGIQKRYYKIAVKLMKRQLYSKEYWMLDENGVPLLNAPKSVVSSEESRINSEEINHNSEEKRQKLKETKQNNNKYFCSKLETSPRPNAAYRLALIDGTYHDVSHEEVEAYRKLYPALDVDQEFRSMIGWLDANPKNRKTPGGINRFINGWLTRSQNQARPAQEKKPTPNGFHNFEERNTDYNAIMMQQLKGWLVVDENKDEGEQKQDGAEK